MKQLVLHPLCTLCSLWLSLIFGCAAKQSAAGDAHSSGVINFADTAHGLRLTYPARWQEQQSLRSRGGVVVLVMPETGRATPPTVSIVVQDRSEDLAPLEQRALAKAKAEVAVFELIETSDATVANAPARRMIYAGRRDGAWIRVMTVITTRGGKAYAISYVADAAAFDDARPDVETIIASIEFVK